VIKAELLIELVMKKIIQKYLEPGRNKNNGSRTKKREKVEET